MFSWFLRRGPHLPAAASISREGSRELTSGAQPIDLAVQHHQSGRLREAQAIYREVLKADPWNFDALHLSGVVAHQLGKHDAAAERILQALSLNPTHAPAQNNLGVVYRAQGRLEQALDCFRKALDVQPGYVDARTNLVETHVILGHRLREKGDLQAAGHHFRTAVTLEPSSAAAHINLGNVLHSLGRAHQAIPHYEKAIKLDAHIPEAHLNLGNALKAEGRLDQALASYRAALALRPDSPETYYALGNALKDQDDVAGMLECYRKALTLNPDYVEARWALAMCQIPAVYEANAETERARAAFTAELEKLESWFGPTRRKHGFSAIGTMQPFLLGYQERDNRALLARYGKLCTKIMSSWFDSERRLRPTRSRAGTILRVGVVSQHFFNHSVWNAIVRGWFRGIDRDRIALYAFHLATIEDKETQLAKKGAAHFQMGQRSLAQWVEAILEQSVDVLLYPEIGMDPMTTRLASMRLAPVQAVSWGHPETSGLPTIDYFVSAQDMEPPNAQNYYTERLHMLPHLGCFFEPMRIAATEPKGYSGLDSAEPVLLCPGVPFKYAPQYDRLLVEIARRLGCCRFVFFRHRLEKISEKLKNRLELAFSQAGLDADRFVSFVPWQTSSEFFGWLRSAHVFLDTIGFSGFNTALQAVQCGTPIVTREGKFMRGRLASGILKRMGLGELVTQSEEEYVALAVRIATEADYREHIRGRIQESSPILFEDVTPVRALEDFLAEATTRHGLHG